MLFRLLEGTLRSFGNLLERLHHQYWFYLKPSPDLYILLSFYIIPVVLLPATLILLVYPIEFFYVFCICLKGLKYWFLLTSVAKPAKEDKGIQPLKMDNADVLKTLIDCQNTDPSIKGKEKTSEKRMIFYVYPEIQRWNKQETEYFFFGVVFILLAVHVVGYIILLLPLVIIKIIFLFCLIFIARNSVCVRIPFNIACVSVHFNPARINPDRHDQNTNTTNVDAAKVNPLY